MGKPIMIILEIIFGMALLALLFVIFKPGISESGNQVVHTSTCLLERTDGELNNHPVLRDNCGYGSNSNSNNKNKNNNKGNNSKNSNNKNKSNNKDNKNSKNNKSNGNNSSDNGGNQSNNGGNSNNGSNNNDGNGGSSNNSNGGNNKPKVVPKGSILIHYIYNNHQVQDNKELYEKVGTPFNINKYDGNNDIPKDYTVDYVTNNTNDFKDAPQEVFVYLKEKDTGKVDQTSILMSRGIINGITQEMFERAPRGDDGVEMPSFFVPNQQYKLYEKYSNMSGFNSDPDSDNGCDFDSENDMGPMISSPIKFTTNINIPDDYDDTSTDEYGGPGADQNVFTKCLDTSQSEWKSGNDKYEVVSSNLKHRGNSVVGSITQTFYRY